MATVQQPLVTVEDFEKMPDPADGSRLELVRGEVVVMPAPKGKHGLCCSKFDRRLGNYVEASVNSLAV